VAASLREVKKRILHCSGRNGLQGMQACFWKVCSAMSNADRLDARGGGWRSCPWAATGDPWSQDWDADALRDIVRDYVIEHWQMTMRSCHRRDWLSQAGQGVVWLARQYTGSAGKIRTARSASSLPTFRVMAMPSSIARCIFQRNGPTIEIVWKPHTCLRHGFATNQSSRRE